MALHDTVSLVDGDGAWVIGADAVEVVAAGM